MPRERVIKAFYLEEPDRVPIFEQEIQPPTSSIVLGRTPTIYNKKQRLRTLMKGFMSTGLLNRMVKDHIDLAKKLKLDAVVLSSNMRLGSFIPIKQVLNKEWIDNNENLIRYFPESDWISTLDLKIIKKGADGLKERIEELNEPVDLDASNFYVFRKVKTVSENRNLNFFIFTSSGLFDWHGKGWIDLALKWFFTQPDLMTKYLDAYNRRAIEVAKIAIDEGANGVLDGGDLAYRHGPMFSPEIYKRFILPYQKMHSDSFHRKGVFIVNRSDGWIWPIANDFLINSGVDGYCEIDKNSGMDLGDLKETYEDRICLLGNVNCARALVNGRIEEVTTETMDCIKKAAPGGGYILCSSNVIHIQVKPENYIAMVKSGQRYGKYS